MSIQLKLHPQPQIEHRSCCRSIFFGSFKKCGRKTFQAEKFWALCCGWNSISSWPANNPHSRWINSTQRVANCRLFLRITIFGAQIRGKLMAGTGSRHPWKGKNHLTFKPPFLGVLFALRFVANELGLKKKPPASQDLVQWLITMVIVFVP